MARAELLATRDGTRPGMRWLLVAVFLAWAVSTVWAKIIHLDISGSDFRAYYTAGRMVLGGVGAEFYDLHTQYTWQRSFLPALTDIQHLFPFLNPPVTALIFAPLATLPFVVAYIIWLGVNLGVLAIVGWQCMRELRQTHSAVTLLALGALLTFPPVLMTVLHGQLSFVLVLALLGGWRALSSGRDFAAGVWISLLSLKPHFVVVAMLGFIVQGRWRVLGGLGLGCGVLTITSLMLVGSSGLRRYVDLLAAVSGWGNAYGVHPQHMHTWRSFLHRLFETDDAADVQTLWLTGVVVALALLCCASVRRQRSHGGLLDLDYAALVVVALLVAPHANLHDLSLLILPGVLVTRYIVLQNPAHPLRLSLATLPWLGYVTVWIYRLWEDDLPFQITVVFAALALAVLTYARVHERKRAPA